MADKRQDDPTWPLPSFDARDWAKAFCARFGGDEDLMLTWFANALMRGFDEAAKGNARLREALRQSENWRAGRMDDSLNGWHSISTAPGETEVIVYCPTEHPRVFTAWRDDDGWVRSRSGRCAPLDDYFGDKDFYPTHWMPLPEPPPAALELSNPVKPKLK